MQGGQVIMHVCMYVYMQQREFCLYHVLNYHEIDHSIDSSYGSLQVVLKTLITRQTFVVGVYSKHTNTIGDRSSLRTTQSICRFRKLLILYSQSQQL